MMNHEISQDAGETYPKWFQEGIQAEMALLPRAEIQAEITILDFKMATIDQRAQNFHF